MKYNRTHEIDGKTYTDEEAWELYKQLKQTFEPVDPVVVHPIQVQPLFPNGIPPVECSTDPYGFNLHPS